MNPEIFTQAFLARIIPSYHEVLLPAIRNFQFEQYPGNAVLAALGALTASVLLYVIGVWLRRLPERVSTPEQQQKIANVREKAQGILPYLLLFAPLPVGGIFIIGAGFFRLPPKTTAAVLIAAEILYRAIPYIRS